MKSADRRIHPCHGSGFPKRSGVCSDAVVGTRDLGGGNAVTIGWLILLVSLLLWLLRATPVRAAGVVGTGTPESCTEAALGAALAGGGLVTFDCGPEPATITLTAEKVIAAGRAPTTVDGGGLVRLSGGNAVRVFSVDTGTVLDVRNLTVANGVRGLDQRGYVRPGIGHTDCSIGAYEADAIPPGPCVGDCDSNGVVSIGELILGVDIALGLQSADACPAFTNADGMVDIAQLIEGVKNALNGCGPELNRKPSYLVSDPVATHYDAVTDDLLTAGLGVAGLQGPVPVPVDPVHPTPAELRRLAIYNNYRGRLDPSTSGGFGRLYGPNISEGVVQAHGGKIAGKEYLFATNNGEERQNVTVMVQIPDSFDPDHPCIVIGASDGSHGVYGAIGTAGEWGLNHRCTVAYTDKGTGNGLHDLDSDQVTLIDGELVSADSAADQTQFTVTDPDLPNYIAAFPHRIAFKHAHSQQNPEKDWGKFVLQAGEVALYILNLPENYGKQVNEDSVVRSLTSDNALIIAAGDSNGGGASLRAAEADRKGLLDAVVACEPNVTPKADLSSQYQGPTGEQPLDPRRTQFL
jgi:hypothetical protein